MRSIILAVALFANWLLWSGHFDSPFLIGLGVLSCVFCVALSYRMRIVDEESVPIQLGLRPFTHYTPWLMKEIVVCNLHVTRVILARKMPLKRSVMDITSQQKTALGRVILANSVTLTPGTVSVNMHGDKITVHSLSFEGTEEDAVGEMNRRINRLEQNI